MTKYIPDWFIYASNRRLARIEESKNMRTYHPHVYEEYCNRLREYLNTVPESCSGTELYEILQKKLAEEN